MSKASLWDERSNKFTQTTRSVHCIISKMSRGKREHHHDFTFNIPRGKFTDGAPIIVLRPQAFVIDDVEMIQYTGTLPIFHEPWQSFKRPQITGQVRSTLDKKDRVHRTAIDLQIKEDEETERKIQDLTQVKEEEDSNTENFSSDEDDMYMDGGHIIDSGANVQHLQMPELESIRPEPLSPIYSDIESSDIESKESKRSNDDRA